MPYRKTYRKRRPIHKRNGRRRFKRIGAKAGSMAYTAFKMAKRLKDAVNIEYKINDVNVTGVSPDYNGAYQTLNAPAQGSTDITRIGDSIKCQNLTMRGIVSGNSTAGTNNVVRLILLWDTQNQYSTLSDLLELTGSSNAVYSPKNYDRRFRNKILWDRTFVVNNIGGNPYVIPFDETFTINDHTQFSAGSTTQFSGSLKLVYLSDRVTTLLPTIWFYSRLSFTDN